ncbi:MAG: Holliday junction resolvase Hjc [Desulfurococcaceae archaeon]
MPINRRRGFAHERDLAKRLYEHGFAVMRAPASGSKAKHLIYPDLIAIYQGKIIACEIKTSKKPRPIYIDKYQVDKLIDFTRRSGGEAYIAVKTIGSGIWTFIPLDQLERTERGRYKITKDLISKGIKLGALIATIKGVKKLTDFTK